MPAQCEVDLGQGTTMKPSLAAGYNLCDLAGARNASQFMPAIACEVSWHWKDAPNMIHSRAGGYPRCGLLLRKDPCLS